MIKIKNWTAKRAGGKITIAGVTLKNEPIKVVGVDTIAPNAKGKIVAAKPDDKFELAIA